MQTVPALTTQRAFPRYVTSCIRSLCQSSQSFRVSCCVCIVLCAAQADSALCANLLLSLGKFMMVDLAFCRDNMNTMAAWLANTCVVCCYTHLETVNHRGMPAILSQLANTRVPY